MTTLGKEWGPYTLPWWQPDPGGEYLGISRESLRLPLPFTHPRDTFRRRLMLGWGIQESFRSQSLTDYAEEFMRAMPLVLDFVRPTA